MGALPPLDEPRTISRTTASARRPATTSETVVLVRPVTRATSARLIGPRSYSVRTTSRSLWIRVWRWVAFVGSAIDAIGPSLGGRSLRSSALDFVQSMDKVRYGDSLC